MLSPLVLIPAFLGTARHRNHPHPLHLLHLHLHHHIYFSFFIILMPTSITNYILYRSLSSNNRSAAARRRQGSAPFNPFSIPPIPDFVVPSHTPVPRPSCPKYVCYVECRIGLVTSACKDCCDKPTKPKQKAEEGEERV
ncbi:hypothetical protein PG988_007771 [Apiospora saccharicola]